MFAALYNAPLFQNTNGIQLLNCGQPMSNDQQSSTSRYPVDCLLKNFFGSGIQTGRSFIKNQNPGIKYQDTGK